jgi:hypothetical protein
MDGTEEYNLNKVRRPKAACSITYVECRPNANAAIS